MKLAFGFILVGLFLIPVAFGQEPAPKKTDSTFVTDTGGGLDASTPAGQTISFTIKIDRVVAETEGDGKLPSGNIQQLIANGIIEDHVLLKISAFDVDRDFVEFPHCTPREFDRVKVNGQNIGTNGAEVFLDGTDRQWRTISYKVPVDLIKFGKWICTPQLSQNCSWQGEGENLIEIEVSTAAPQPYPCGNTTVNWETKVAWGAISFKALYPVILLHGYSSDGAFWSRSEHDFTQPLRARKMLYDNSINFQNRGKDDIFTDAYHLLGEIQRIAEEKFHVRHVHIVAHSKGGLAARSYLGTFIIPNLVVASLTTLSTPHRGTAQADLSLDLREVGIAGAFRTGDTLSEDFKLALSRIFARGDGAIANMRVKYMRDEFNPENEPRLPAKMKAFDKEVAVRYFSYGADANDGTVDPLTTEPTISDQEAAGSPFVNKLIVGPIFGRRAAEEAYRHLWYYSETRVVDYDIVSGEEVPQYIYRDPSGGLQGSNDFFVTTKSAEFPTTHKITPQHQTPNEHRNHPMIAATDVAIKVIELIKSSNPN